MANYTTNDKGDTVLAVGAPGSPIRAKDEHPQKIEDLNEFHGIGCDMDEAKEYLIDCGIKSVLERRSILSNTSYKDQL